MPNLMSCWQAAISRKRRLARSSPKEVSVAEINARRHNDIRVMCLRIFADASGETHMEDFEIAFQPRKLFEDNAPLRLSDNFPTSWGNICHVPSGMGEVDWH